MSLSFSLGAAAAAGMCASPARAVIKAAGVRTAVAGSRSGDDAAPADARWRLATGPWGLIVLLAAGAWGVTLRVHPPMVAAAACWLMICGVPLAAIDVRARRLPNGLTVPCLVGVAGLLGTAAIRTASWPDVVTAGAGGLAVGGFFGLLALTRPGSAGLGDAKFGLSTGALAGWFGWGTLLESVVAAFVLAAVCGLWLVATRRASLRGTSLPFGPFLLAGCLTVVLLAGVGQGHHVVALL